MKFTWDCSRKIQHTAKNKVKGILCFKNSTWLRRDWCFFSFASEAQLFYLQHVSWISSIMGSVWNNNILYLSLAFIRKRFAVSRENVAYTAKVSRLFANVSRLFALNRNSLPLDRKRYALLRKMSCYIAKVSRLLTKKGFFTYFIELHGISLFP